MNVNASFNGVESLRLIATSAEMTWSGRLRVQGNPHRLGATRGLLEDHRRPRLCA
jgi:hypothetical protein